MDTGKTTLLILVIRLLGDYASSIQIESLMSKYDSQTQRHFFTNESHQKEQKTVLTLGTLQQLSSKLQIRLTSSTPVILRYKGPTVLLTQLFREPSGPIGGHDALVLLSLVLVESASSAWVWLETVSDRG
jgi:hypothetical protein